jgi:hypothetical protein
MKIDNNKLEVEIELLEFDLIDGEFTSKEAMEIIGHLLQKKMEFHDLKSFSSLIRTGIDDSISLNRIEKLKLSEKKFQAFIQNVNLEPSKLSIQSTISIKVIK